MAAITESTIDGRRARRHRSRDLAVDALLDLLNEGVVRPTAQQVAERSGVSLRSIFRIFDDVESLNAAACARQVTRVRHLFVDVPADGTLDTRIDQFVTINGRLYESIAPVRRAALRIAPESVAVQDTLARGTRLGAGRGRAGLRRGARHRRPRHGRRAGARAVVRGVGPAPLRAGPVVQSHLGDPLGAAPRDPRPDRASLTRLDAPTE